jgi:chromosome segregation ATPase
MRSTKSKCEALDIWKLMTFRELFNSQISELTEKFNYLKQSFNIEKEKLVQKINSLQKNKDSIEMSNAKLISENKNLSVELKIASQNCKNKDKTIESLKVAHQLAQSKASEPDMNHAIQRKIGEVREEADREVQRYRAQIIDLQSLIASLMKEKQQLKDILEEKEVVDSLQKENMQLNTELTKAKEMIENLQAELN